MDIINAVIYARFSNQNQTEASIDAQVRACREYAKNNGINIINIYKDEAKSGTTANRPSFQQMLTDSRDGDFDIVLVHKLDRFARNRVDAFMSKATLEKNGVSVVSVTEPLDDSPESLMMESVIEGMAQYYSMNLGREVRKGQLEAALKNQFLGGKPPLGYKIRNQQYVIDEYNAKAVKIIFDMYCSGYSYNKIASALNDKGYMTQRGKEFSKNSIRDILMNERYTGVYIYNQRKSKGKYSRTRNNNAHKDVSDIIRCDGAIPQIISKEQFAKAQSILKEHEHLKGGKKHRYILSGKVKCECGGIMNGNTRKSGRNKIQHSYYRCNRCSHEINVKYLDTFVIKAISKTIMHSIDKSLKYLTDEVNVYADSQKENTCQELHALKMNIDGNDKKIDNLLGKLSDIEGASRLSHTLTDKIDALTKANDSLKEQKEVLEESLNIKYSKEQVRNAYHSLSSYINEHDTIAVRNFIYSYVKQVIVDKDNDLVTVETV